MNRTNATGAIHARKIETKKTEKEKMEKAKSKYVLESGNENKQTHRRLTLFFKKSFFIL